MVVLLRGSRRVEKPGRRAVLMPVQEHPASGEPGFSCSGDYMKFTAAANCAILPRPRVHPDSSP
jgi:hypothetical protein